MASDVKVIINQARVLGGTGFGSPLLFAGMQEKAVPYTEVSGVDEVSAALTKAGILQENMQNHPLYKAATLCFAQAVPPAKVAVMATKENAVASLGSVWLQDWRQLVVATLGQDTESMVQEIAAYVEANASPAKIFFASVKSLAEISGNGAKIDKYTRTFCMVYPSEVTAPEAAVVGATAGYPAGSITYKNVILNGIEPVDMSDAELAAIHEAGAYSVVKKAGDIVTSEGKVGAGEYLDVIDGKDFIIMNIEYQTQRTLNAVPKIPYDNNGIALLEGVCQNVLQTAYTQGIIAVTDNGVPDYSVNYAPRSATNASDRANRKYIEGSFRFALAGAVHEAVIYGTIEI